jgi:hypothetical protein
MSLKSRISVLAEEFSAGVLAAIRSASLEEILAEGPRAGRATSTTASSSAAPAPRSQGRKPGRLQRRSPEQIGEVVDAIVGALKKNKAGMRSEQLQKLLSLDKREISGPLAEALDGKKIAKKGERRATTYFVR